MLLVGCFSNKVDRLCLRKAAHRKGGKMAELSRPSDDSADQSVDCGGPSLGLVFVVALVGTPNKGRRNWYTWYGLLFISAIHSF